jgi:branched-chain amino acid transport system ATP-binding protein
VTAALETQDLCMRFGALNVTDRVNFRLERGARHALIGPNGAGKTTFVNLLTGRLRPTSGKVLLEGQDITALPQAQRVKRGLARTFQINTLFLDMTAVDNVCLAVAERRGLGARVFPAAGRYRAVIDESMAILESLHLTVEATRVVAELAYGKQRMVELAIALALRPKVLLLDEPAAGVPSQETDHILAVLQALPADIAILIIEHDMDLVFRFASKITVLALGTTLAEGTPAEITANPKVREVYLGERRD